MTRPIYLYPIEDTFAKIQQQALEHLGQPLYSWAANPARLDVQSGAPADGRDQGSIFNQLGEIRWRRQADRFQALMILDQPILGLEALPGFSATDQTVFLQALQERGLAAISEIAPQTGISQSKTLQARLVLQDGVAVLISPRAFVQEAE